MLGNRVSELKGDAQKGVKWLFYEIDRGIKKREKHLKRWKKNESFEDMEQWDGEKGEGDQPTINKIGTYIRTRRAILGFNNPRVTAEPKTADGYDPIQIPQIGDGGTIGQGQDGPVGVQEVSKHRAVEGLINGTVEAPLFGMQATMTRLIKAGDLSYGVLKSWHIPDIETKNADDPAPQKIKMGADGALDVSDYATNKIDGSVIEDDSGKRLIPKGDIPSWEHYGIDWVSAHRIILDPDCGNDLDRLRWVVEEEERSLADVKADPLFKNTKDLKSTSKALWEGDGPAPSWYSDEETKERREMVRLFHFWDCLNDKYFVLADGHGKYLRDGPTPDGVFGHPYSFYRNNEKSGDGSDAYQRPLTTDLIPIAIQYNIAIQDLMRAMDATRKILVRDGALDPANEDALTNGDDMAVVKIAKKALIDNSGFDGAVRAWTPPPVSETLYQNIKRFDLDFWETAGLPPEAAGSPKSETATQVNEMSQYSGTRIQVDRACLGECLRTAFKKMWDIMEATMTRERAVKMIGEDGSIFTGVVDMEMVKSDYDINIDVEDMAPRNSMAEGAQMIQLVNVLGDKPWLVATRPQAQEFCGKFGIKNDMFIDALVAEAQKRLQLEQMQIMAAMAPPQGAPDEQPEAPPPTSEADAVSQTGAGSQVPNMQGAA